MMLFAANSQNLMLHQERSAFEKLGEYSRYRRGWAYGNGLPFERSIVDIAQSLLAAGYSNGFAVADAFPGLEGEIRITFYLGSEYLEFTVLSSGQIDYTRERQNQILSDRSGLSKQDAIGEIEREGRLKWTASALSPLNISITGLGDSRTWLLNRQLPTAQSQYSTQTVLDQVRDLSATI